MSVTSLVPTLLTLAEAAERAGSVSERTLRREVARGNLATRRIGRCLRVTDEELARWIREGRPESEAS